jgi:hypothetical protein
MLALLASWRLMRMLALLALWRCYVRVAHLLFLHHGAMRAHTMTSYARPCRITIGSGISLDPCWPLMSTGLGDHTPPHQPTPDNDHCQGIERLSLATAIEFGDRLLHSLTMPRSRTGATDAEPPASHDAGPASATVAAAHEETTSFMARLPTELLLHVFTLLDSETLLLSVPGKLSLHRSRFNLRAGPRPLHLGSSCCFTALPLTRLACC